MPTLETRRVAPARTTDRVVAAWAGAPTALRRAVLAACVTSAALCPLVAAPTTVRLSVAAAGAVLGVAAMVDVREHKLPNRLLLVALSAVVAGVLAAGSVDVVVRATVGMLLGGGLMLVVHLTRGVGMGDVKMAGVVGASVGAVELRAVPVSIAVAAILAAAYGLVAHRQRVSLGPALWVGWAVSLAATAAGWLS